MPGGLGEIGSESGRMIFYPKSLNRKRKTTTLTLNTLVVKVENKKTEKKLAVECQTLSVPCVFTVTDTHAETIKRKNR
jgi:hypothetical protein